MKCPFCIKVCSRCKKILVLNSNNFPKRKDSKDGFRNECKPCVKKKMKKYREENGDKLREYDRERYLKRKDEVLEYQKEYYKNNKEKIKDYRKKWYSDNIDQRKEYEKEYRETHKEEIREKNQKYYEDNKEQILEYKKEWRMNNPDKTFNYSCKRRVKEKQGHEITKEQWLEMMNFFEWKCAYSGEYIGGKENKDIRSIDHIIPLDTFGEHEIWNLVPMKITYNKSKSTRDMFEWYSQQEFYSEERLLKIYQWIEYAKNKWNN